MLILPFMLVGLLVFIIFFAGVWKMFEKAGQPGWASIIPLYNVYIMTKLAGKPSWWVLLLFIPFANFIMVVWLLNMISKSFGKDEAFTLGLLLLGPIFWLILGFGAAKYLGPFGDPAAFNAYRGKDKFEFEL